VQALWGGSRESAGKSQRKGCGLFLRRPFELGNRKGLDKILHDCPVIFAEAGSPNSRTLQCRLQVRCVEHPVIAEIRFIRSEHFQDQAPASFCPGGYTFFDFIHNRGMCTSLDAQLWEKIVVVSDWKASSSLFQSSIFNSQIPALIPTDRP